MGLVTVVALALVIASRLALPPVGSPDTSGSEHHTTAPDDEASPDPAPAPDPDAGPTPEDPSTGALVAVSVPVVIPPSTDTVPPAASPSAAQAPVTSTTPPSEQDPAASAITDDSSDARHDGSGHGGSRDDQCAGDRDRDRDRGDRSRHDTGHR